MIIFQYLTQCTQCFIINTYISYLLRGRRGVIVRSWIYTKVVSSNPVHGGFLHQ
jgi:hypothetical protein